MPARTPLSGCDKVRADDICHRSVGPGAAPRTRCDLFADQPTQGVNLNINALDIALAVDAFRGRDYPFPGPTAPNPCPP